MTTTAPEASRAPRPTADQMAERVKAVLALLPESDSTLLASDIREALQLTVPQTDLLIKKMLEGGLLHVSGFADKHRVLSRGFGGSHELRAVSTRDFITHLQLGQSLQVTALRLDDGRPVVEVETAGGVALLRAV